MNVEPTVKPLMMSSSIVLAASFTFQRWRAAQGRPQSYWKRGSEGINPGCVWKGEARGSAKHSTCVSQLGSSSDCSTVADRVRQAENRKICFRSTRYKYPCHPMHTRARHQTSSGPSSSSQCSVLSRLSTSWALSQSPHVDLLQHPSQQLTVGSQQQVSPWRAS